MEEDKKSLVNEVAATGYNAAEKPFDFIAADSQTALVCEADPSVKAEITKVLAGMNYHVTEAASGREALKNMRFHLYNLIILDENFGMVNAQDTNDVLNYLQNLFTATRRSIFVVLLTDNYRTMDSMMAFNKSVNLVINKKNMDNFAAIIEGGLEENKAFYGIFKDALRKQGRV